MKERLARNIANVMGENVVRELGNPSRGRHLMANLITMFNKLVMGIALVIVKEQMEWERLEGGNLVH